MKYLKTKNISRFSVKDNTYIQNTYGRITIDSNNGMRLPKGATSERPNTSTIPNLSGTIRYNTTTHTIEAYIGAPGFEAWETVRAPAASTIIKQTIGPGDAVEQLFGPLNTSYTATYLASPDNIIVLVENVFQIATTNFSIVQDPAGVPQAAFYSGAGSYPTGYYLEFSDPVPIGKNVTVYYGFTN